MSTAYIFDIDGVLLDVSQRVFMAERLSNGDVLLFWKYFFSEELLQFDKPRRIGINTLLDRMARGAIILVTGRPSHLRRATLNQLQSIGIPVSKIKHIYMRSSSDYRKSYLFKLEAIERMLSKGYVILEIHDDDEEFLKRVRERIANSRLYLHSGDQIIELGRQNTLIW